jgi:hypothetical protein
MRRDGWMDRQTEIVKLTGTFFQLFIGNTLKMEKSKNTPLLQNQSKQISNKGIYLMMAIDFFKVYTGISRLQCQFQFLK